MENRESKPVFTLAGTKKYLSFLWQFAKKEKPVYNLKSVKIPRTSGRTLKILAFLLRAPGTRSLLIPLLLRQAGIQSLRKCQVGEEPLMHPVHPAESQITPAAAKKSIKHFFDSFENKQVSESSAKGTGSEKKSLFQPETVMDFHRAYLEGKTTPVDVAMRLLDIIRSIEESAVPLRPYVAWEERELMRQANTSAERFEKGKSLGILDGVPVSVKDELDMLPFMTMIGTKFYNKHPPDQDATSVERLRSAGALMVGKTNMHEIGLGVTGQNTHYGTTRNRFPASLCGVVGLKSTWGRVSTSGSAQLHWSIGTVGPITSTARDAALAYSFLAGPDPRQWSTQSQPPVELKDIEKSNLEGVRLGVFYPWFKHASADVVRSCEQMLDSFKSQGATVQEIEIPQLDEIRMAHAVTITTEMVTSLKSYFKTFRQPFGFDAMINLTLAKQFTGSEYVKAQRVRAKMIVNIKQIFQNVDAIVTPSTACTAPPILADALTNGESDLSTLTELMRFAPQANLGGFPAISFPVGYDAKGLPVGMQLMGRPWEESLLLRVAKTSEKFFTRHPPMMRFSLLPN